MGEREARLARDGVDAFNRRDVERLKQLTHPEGELFGIRSALEGTSYKGREGIERFWADALETWEELRMEDPQVFHRDERALVICRFVARGRGSGAEIEQPMAWLIEVRDGMMLRGRTTLDVEAARREFDEGAAAG